MGAAGGARPRRTTRNLTAAARFGPSLPVSGYPRCTAAGRSRSGIVEPKGVSLLKSFIFRVALAAAAILAATGLISGAAVASSESSLSPSGAFSVSVWYPDVIAAGTTATASESVSNFSAATERLTLTNTLVGSNGKTYVQTQTVSIAPGETLTQSFSTKVNRSDVGSYTLTFTASDGAESATATASFTVVKK